MPIQTFSNMQKTIFLFFMTIVLCQITTGQNTITGLLTDNQNNPVPYASISYRTTGKGVISNADGRFSIEKIANDTIYISCLGFQKMEISVNKCIQGLNKIVLQPATYSLGEVTVKPVDARELMKKVIKMIPKNYPSGTTKINGLYKQASFSENKPTGLFEADMDIFISDVNSKREPKFETKVHSHELFKSSTLFSINDPTENIVYCWIRTHPFIQRFNKYNFHYKGMITYNNTLLDRIEFEPKKNYRYIFLYKGSVYIDHSTNAIVYIEYQKVSKEGFHKYQKTKLRSVDQALYKIKYSKFNEYYYLDYVIKENVIRIIQQTKNRRFQLHSFFNFFTKETENNVEKYDVDSLSLYDIAIHGIGKDVDQSKGKENTFILDTEEEKKIKEMSDK